MQYEPLPARVEEIATAIVDAAYTVHEALGPGLLESVYETCLCHELTKRGLRWERQMPVEVVYDGILFEEGFRLDVLVEDEVIVEVKSAITMHPAFTAQLLTYLKLKRKRLGFVINFGLPRVAEGIKRVIR